MALTYEEKIAIAKLKAEGLSAYAIIVCDSDLGTLDPCILR